MYEALRRGRRVKLKQVGIFADGVAVRQAGKEPFRVAREHVDEIITDLGLSFPILYDDRKVAARLYEPSSIPLTLLIDPHGIVRYTHKKYRRGDEDVYREQLQTLLSE